MYLGVDTTLMDVLPTSQSLDLPGKMPGHLTYISKPVLEDASQPFTEVKKCA